VRKVREGEVIVAQGDAGQDLFVLLDGVIAIDVDGKELAQLGPGAVLGERSVLEGGKRTATMRAVTNCKLAVAEAKDIDREALVQLSLGHRREEATR